MALALAGCSAFGDGGAAGGGIGSTLGNMMRYGSSTEPPVAAAQPIEATDCPGVIVTEGRSAIRQGGSQVSIANVARECFERPGGAIAVKVGVEGRALLGAGGGTGRFDVPIAFAIKRGDRVLTSKVQRVSVVIPAGQSQASFVAIQPDLIVPPGTGEYDIEIGLGATATAASARRAGR